LDIVIRSENLIAGIENKIFADIYNDLEDYSNHLQELAKPTGRPPLKIIICLGKEKPANDHGFKIISYEEFFERLLQNLGPAIPHADPQYLSLLLNFIATIRNLKRGTHMDDQTIQFFKDNSKVAFELYVKTDELLREFRSKTKQLRKGLGDLPSNVSCGVWDGTEQESEFHSTVYCDLEVEKGLTIAFDARVTLNGWRINAFPRKENQAQGEVNNWLQKRGIPSLKCSEREWIYAQFDFKEKVETVAKEFRELIVSVHSRV